MKRKFILSWLLLLPIGITPPVFLQASTQPIRALQQNPTTVILIRHAEKEKNGSKDPQLTEKGRQRAKAFAAMFGLITADAIYSSNYNRTIATARPFAEQQGLEIQIYDPKAQQDFLDKALREHAGGNIVVVGHSNTVPDAVNYLLKQELVKEMSEEEYNKVFIVSILADGTASYIPLVLDI
jgi:2,3-bisphosphoglycerate-dependent phosphoglycerate mutase